MLRIVPIAELSPAGEAALARAREGLFGIHPLTADQSGTKKKPRLRGYQTEATRDAATLSRWWRQWPDDNIGGVIPPGLVILDVDPRHGGEQALALLEQQHGCLPETVTVRTAGGGLHVYFRIPAAIVPRKDVYVVANGHALELLCAGHNVVLPGSVNGDRVYTYIPGNAPEEVELALCPEWLLVIIEQDDRPHTLSPSAPTASRWSTLDVRSFPAGTRNCGLASLAGKLVSAGLRDHVLTDALLAANARQCHPPLESTEVEKVARSIQRTHDHKDPEARLASQSRAAILHIAAAALHCPWPGRTGTRQQIALFAFCTVAYYCARLVFQASQRQLAEAAGMTYVTLRKAIPTLVDTGWIAIDANRKPHAGRDAHGTVYRLHCPAAVAVKSYTNKSTPLLLALLGKKLTAQDAYRWRGLGKVALIVVIALGQGSLSERALRDKVGKSRNTMKSVLRKLIDARLVNEAEGRYTLAEHNEEQLTGVAVRLGVQGRGDRQHEQHCYERHKYLEQLGRRASRRAPSHGAFPEEGIDENCNRQHSETMDLRVDRKSD